MSTNAKISVLFDGYCVICNQTRRTVQALDWLNRVEFVDIHNWSTVEQRYPQLEFETAMGQVHVALPDGRLVGGFDGTRAMLRQLPLGYPFWLLFSLPVMRDRVGPAVYRFIARNRYRINRFFGVDICEDGSCKIPQ